MPYSVGSNFVHHLRGGSAKIARRLYVNSVDYSQHVKKWPSIKRDWDSVRSANVGIGLENGSQLFNFFYSDKTRVNDAVNVDYGISYQSHNLFTYSHIFSATDWAKAECNVAVDVIDNPLDGVQDVDKLFDTTATNTTHSVSQTFADPGVTPQGPGNDAWKFWTQVYARPAESKAFRMDLDYDNDSVNVLFDVESGTVRSSLSEGQLDPEDWFIRQNTNGFYHCGVKWAVFDSGSRSLTHRFVLADPNSKDVLQYTGNGSSGMYFYGAQLQKAYYSESDRYYMTGATGQGPFGMNLGKYTQVFSSTDWSKAAGTFLTLNNSIAPDGTTTAVLAQNSNNSVSGNLAFQYSLTDAEQSQEDYWCASVFVKKGTATNFRILTRMFPVNSSALAQGHQVWFAPAFGTISVNSQYRLVGTSGTSWISAGGVDEYVASIAGQDAWWRVWATIKNPRENTLFPGQNNNIHQTNLYPATSPNSGTCGLWGFQLEVGGKELLDGPGPYVAVHTTGVVYPSNAEDMINVFDGKVRSAEFAKGSVRIQAKDKIKELSQRIVGTGEAPVQINSITPSWLAFVLCSSYGGFSSIESTNNPDIDYSAVDSWDAHNTSNAVHVKCDFRGIKVTEALKRLSTMTRVAMYLEEDRITFKRWTTVSTQVMSIGNDSIVDLNVSVNDEKLVNKQWIFGDWDQGSEYFKIALFEEDTASQNTYGMHEEVIKDQAIFYPNSGPALDTAQRIITTEAEPIDTMRVTALPSAVRMQIGESITVIGPQVGVASTYRIMSQEIDMDKDRVKMSLDNSQVVFGNPFTLDTSSLAGGDILA